MEPIEIVGYIAAVLTTISFVPQAAKIIKTKDTKSISLGMYALFSIGNLFGHFGKKFYLCTEYEI